MTRSTEAPSEEVVERDGLDCPECEGNGWTVGVGVECQERCCGQSDWECGARGCIGPRQEQVQVQIQEQCEKCEGTGRITALSSHDTRIWDKAIEAAAKVAESGLWGPFDIPDNLAEAKERIAASIRTLSPEDK